jgi:hypothetical protein
MNTYDVLLTDSTVETVNAEEIEIDNGNLVFYCKDEVVATYAAYFWIKAMLTSQPCKV